ncbi:UxaA family hydrolase [Budvicia aquatica]|uniref:Altronate dehydratase n=1 Tax=Budvicia aquatica TaxID=82979 RepID=A0A2C6DGP3_9GAMM|nr:altronate dehydratase family protein [Budvicia aquatica]PHI30376.1 altronate dehydratase [Budvicia aquatica]VFS49503.1 D-galactarate dehydratase [Budvicia aquatica]
MQKILCIHPDDDMLVALKDVYQGEQVSWNDERFTLVTETPAKHKFARRDVQAGDILCLYGVPVAKATRPIAKGETVTTENIQHYAAEVDVNSARPYHWQAPDVSQWQGRMFNGVIRADGRIGTANYWLIIPLVFCENRTVEKLRDALEKPLGYRTDDLTSLTASLLGQLSENHDPVIPRPFPNLDGIRIITHNSGCGGTTVDSQSLCKILAAYADHPNVAGITVFSLGCEKAQIKMFKQALNTRNPDFDKPCLIYRQQDWHSEAEMMQRAVAETFEHLKDANKFVRQPVPVSALKIGVKCGGSDGFSGISANPAMGVVSDLLVTLGGGSVLAEFPELCGAEANMIDRCLKREDKQRFVDLMQRYEVEAQACGASIADNPSPGNIKDGLITDAIKSTGAAKKAGTAPITSVLDYGEPMPDSGLSLLCTPGNDVEAVTGMVASGANVVIFSTGLGTPTGNPIVPVLKIATNTTMANKLSDMIDFDCGPIIDGVAINAIGEQLFDKVIETAGRDYIVKADRLAQYDFIFWKRETSL